MRGDLSLLLGIGVGFIAKRLVAVLISPVGKTKECGQLPGPTLEIAQGGRSRSRGS